MKYNFIVEKIWKERYDGHFFKLNSQATSKDEEQKLSKIMGFPFDKEDVLSLRVGLLWSNFTCCMGELGGIQFGHMYSSAPGFISFIKNNLPKLEDLGILDTFKRSIRESIWHKHTAYAKRSYIYNLPLKNKQQRPDLESVGENLSKAYPFNFEGVVSHTPSNDGEYDVYQLKFSKPI